MVGARRRAPHRGVVLLLLFWRHVHDRAALDVADGDDHTGECQLRSVVFEMLFSSEAEVALGFLVATALTYHVSVALFRLPRVLHHFEDSFPHPLLDLPDHPDCNVLLCALQNLGRDDDGERIFF